MTALDVLQRIVEWVRKGYPQGVPQTDYLPLIALLGYHLSEEETVVVASQLLDDDPKADSSKQIRDAIRQVTDTPPSKADVERIRGLLKDAGWNLDNAVKD